MLIMEIAKNYRFFMTVKVYVKWVTKCYCHIPNNSTGWNKSKGHDNTSISNNSTGQNKSIGWKIPRNQITV